MSLCHCGGRRVGACAISQLLRPARQQHSSALGGYGGLVSYLRHPSKEQEVPPVHCRERTQPFKTKTVRNHARNV